MQAVMPIGWDQCRDRLSRFTSGDINTEKFLRERRKKQQIVNTVQFAIPSVKEFRLQKFLR